MVKRTEAKPTQSEIDAAVQQSAEFVQSQEEPPESHPGPTTPSSAEVEAAVEQSAEFLQSQGVTTDTSTSAAAPVSAGTSAPGAAPVYAGRDKSMDASPVFESPVPDKPKD